MEHVLGYPGWIDDWKSSERPSFVCVLSPFYSFRIVCLLCLFQAPTVLTPTHSGRPLSRHQFTQVLHRQRLIFAAISSLGTNPLPGRSGIPPLPPPPFYSKVLRRERGPCPFLHMSGAHSFAPTTLPPCCLSQPFFHNFSSHLLLRPP